MYLVVCSSDGVIFDQIESYEDALAIKQTFDTDPVRRYPWWWPRRFMKTVDCTHRIELEP